MSDKPTPTPQPPKRKRRKKEAGFGPARSSDKPLKPRSGNGSPTLVFNPSIHETVRDLARWGMPQADICNFVKNPDTGMPIDVKTLARHFREELDDGMNEGNKMIIRNAFRLCQWIEEVKEGERIVTPERLPDRMMLKFMLQTRPGLRWREAKEEEKPTDANAVDEDIRRVLAPLTYDEKIALRDTLEQKLLGRSDRNDGGEAEGVD